MKLCGHVQRGDVVYNKNRMLRKELPGERKRRMGESKDAEVIIGNNKDGQN